LENMGRNKVNQTETQTIQDSVTPDATVADAQTPDTPVQPITSDIPSKVLLSSEAPLIYGNNPTAQEIEDFKKAYLEWLNK
jgi:hypothetical protein